MRRRVSVMLAEFERRVPYAGKLLDVFAPGRSAGAVTRRNTLAAYNRVYASDRLLHEYLSPERLSFYEELATIFAPLGPKRLIDVGCGTGHLLRFTADRMAVPPERIVGVDHSEDGIGRGRQLLPSATWIVADLYDLALTEEFDLVLCTEVLEHLDEPGRAVDQLLRLCAPDGRVAITVPDGAQDHWEGHINYWDESQLGAFLTPSGLTAIERIEDGRAFLAWLSPAA